MSKQPSNQTKRNLLRRGLAGILLLAMLFGLLPSTVFTARAASWADPYVETLVDWGVMRGDISGNMAPDRSITRAEFVTMMNRAYGYTKLGGHPFTDVRVRDWYYEDIDIAYNIGYFKGTGPTTASPNDTLTREQAAVLLARNMMLQETVGETLGFSDSRSLNDWSRGLVGAAAANGIISGYNDGSFQPSRNITRGEVAAMLVRAIGTPIQTEGEHALGNVYGNVTVNTSGVKLRDGVIVGNLYLTGGIDLGDVLLENITVLGEIIVSGGGESNSSAASIVMRNVTADNMIVDSIADQFVTIRAEGVTDIPTTTVRTNAYVDDSSLPGYGLSYITLDGEAGALLQLAGNVKEVLNRTPESNLQVVQGSADKITVDENATGSSVLVDGDAQVGDLNLDVGTTVTGTGDIKNLNVGAAGSTVEQLPDDITIRPGITADINGSNMNSTQAAESSADPKLLAGYPAVKNIAPTSATLVFRANKPGTIYWAISAVADGSVKEADLLEPPVYGGNVLQSGTITAAAANTEYTAAITGLTQDGSYYVTAMLVDGRDQHSPIKVTSFSTPDGTVPAFNQGYPYMSRITTENSQVTVSTNKSCLLYYALLPRGSTAPTPAEFKANAISGNLGYGTIDTVKNVTQPFQVNSTRLKELTDYTLYLWLTDYDGAQSSAVVALNFTTPDEQPPVIVSAEPTRPGPNSVDVTFVINEAATLYWAVVPEGMYEEVRFEGIDDEEWSPDEVANPEDARLQIKVENGAGNSISSGNARVTAGYVNGTAQVRNLDPTVHGTSTFTMYMVAKDAAGNYSKVQKITIRVTDTTRPTVELEFDPANENNPKQPSVTADAQLVFSEKVKGTGSEEDFETLYRKVESSIGFEKADAMNAWAAVLSKYITLYYGTVGNNNGSASDDRNPVKPVVTQCQFDEGTNSFRFGTMVGGQFVESSDWVVNYCDATLSTDRDNRMIIEFPAYNEETGRGALKLNSGTTYHFTVEDVVDTSEEANALNPNPTRLDFTTLAAQVDLEAVSERPPVIRKAVMKDEANVPNRGKTIFEVNDATTVPTLSPLTGWPTQIYDPSGRGSGTYTYWKSNEPQRIDKAFTVDSTNLGNVEKSNKMCYDILIWSDKNMEITLYSRPLNENGVGTGDWEWEGVMNFNGASSTSLVFQSLNSLRRDIDPSYYPDYLANIESREYAIHVEQLDMMGDFTPIKADWDDKIQIKVSVVAGGDVALDQLSKVGSNHQTRYEEALAGGLSAIGNPNPLEGLDMRIDFDRTGAPEIQGTSLRNLTSTSAEVGFLMKTSGKVNYLVIQVTGIEYTDTSTGQAQTKTHTGANDTTPISDILGSITKYSTDTLVAVPGTGDTVINYPPIKKSDGTDNIVPFNAAPGGKGTLLSNPTWRVVKNGNFDDFETIKKGLTPLVMANSYTWIPTAELDGWLKPNNLYFVVAVPEGENDDTCSDEAMLYYFTTPTSPRPTINLRSSGTTEVSAVVNYTAEVSMKMLIMGTVYGTDLNKPFANYATKEGKEWVADYLKNSGKTSFTVLDALSTNYTDGGVVKGGIYPSVFDQFADTYIRDFVLDLATQQGGIDDLTKGYWGPETVAVGSNQATVTKEMKLTGTNSQLVSRTNYACLAIARGGSDDIVSFRAVYPLQVMDEKDLTVDAADPSLEYTAADNTISGSILITFSDTIYRAPDGFPRREVVQSSTSSMGGNTVAGTNYYGAIPGITSGSGALKIPEAENSAYSPTSTLIVQIDKFKATSDLTIVVSGFCNGSSKTMVTHRIIIHCDKATNTFTSEIRTGAG